MRRPATRAFTLMELMMVMAILVVLLALAVPGATQVWSTLASTQCQQHLAAIFQAQTAWRVDSGGQTLCGKGWAGKLLPYLEQREDILRCPSAADVALWVPAANVGGNAASESLAQPPGSERLESAFEIQVYRLEEYGAGPGGEATGSGARRELAYTIPLDAHPWVRRTQQGNAVLYDVDDEGAAGGVERPITCDDIRFLISYENGWPRSLQVLEQACRVSPHKKFAYDFLVNGEVLVSDWVKHVGESYDLARADQAGVTGSGDAATPQAGRRASGGALTRYLIVPSDYGLSKGTYSLPSSIRDSMDPRLAMVLDYPKALAEYTGDGGDEWKWDKYFIENPRRWKKEWGATGEDWNEYQALRHFGRANILFCDGHIESFGPEDLRPGRALWSGQGW